MRRRTLWTALLLGGWLALAGAPRSFSQTIFPTVTAQNLAKEKVTLPGGLAGSRDLLLISFAPEQQTDVNTWLPAAQALQHMNFDFHYYQLPVQGRENFVFRWWETSSMRSDQTDPESWPWIVPLFVNEHKFLHDLEIPNAKQVVALLVNREGRVLWRSYGPMTPRARMELMAAAGERG